LINEDSDAKPTSVIFQHRPRLSSVRRTNEESELIPTSVIASHPVRSRLRREAKVDNKDKPLSDMSAPSDFHESNRFNRSATSETNRASVPRLYLLSSYRRNVLSCTATRMLLLTRAHNTAVRVSEMANSRMCLEVSRVRHTDWTAGEKEEDDDEEDEDKEEDDEEEE
jgi:hypothetical protein